MEASKEQQTTESTKIFQAIGVIYGQVILDERQKMTIEMEGERFKLTCGKRMRQRFLQELETQPNRFFYFKAYPNFHLHTHKISFLAITFYISPPEKFQVNQFLLAGVWQFNKHLRDQPVISIYRNQLRFGESPYKFIVNHIPVVGFESQPYFYRQRHDATATTRKFYELIVTFNPQKKQFNFLLLLDSTEEIPKYVKRKFRKPKPDPKSLAIKVTQMNFSVLKKTAMKLREAGFFEGKISGKGVTKESLTNMVQESLKSHPDAVKALEGVSSN